MKKLLAIGEALIDMIPSNIGRICDVESFSPKIGGAPLNVAGAYSKLGGQSYIITMLGDDPFGYKIIKELNEYNIHTDYIKFTDKANTSLAFVALDDDANREFSFYRNLGSDMIMSDEDINVDWFYDAYCLHFCSVSLGDFPMKKAHDKALEYAKNNNMIVSFDPNVRLALFKDHDYLRKTINDYFKYADIVKIADDEVNFIFGNNDIEDNLTYLFDSGVKLIIYTKGKNGAVAYTKNNKVESLGIRVKSIDTTGAGDAFIASILYLLAKADIKIDDINNLSKETLLEYLEFANRYAAISTTKKGAIAAYPYYKELI